MLVRESNYLTRWATRALVDIRRAWRYQRGNQNPYCEEQTTQWSTEKVQKDRQRSTKHTYKIKDREARTPRALKSGGELRCSGRVGRFIFQPTNQRWAYQERIYSKNYCSGRVSSSCSTSDSRRVNLVTNPVISHERGKDREVFTTGGTYPWSFVTQIFHNGQPSRSGDRKTFGVMTST